MKQTMIVVLFIFFCFVWSQPFVYPEAWSTSVGSEVQTGETLTLGTVSDYKTLNPFLVQEVANIPSQFTADGLFKLDPSTLEYIPYMATSYSVSDDQLTWTFNLREGMKWSDGKAITAQDWVTTWQLFIDPAIPSAFTDQFYIDGKLVTVEMLDDLTLQMTFPKAQATAIEVASYYVFPAHVFGPVYESAGAEGIRNMWTLETPASEIVSSGPFKLASYQIGERVTFEKNPYFGDWNKDVRGNVLPYLDGYSRRIFRDNTSYLAEYLAGNLDSYAPTTLEELGQIKALIDAGQPLVLKANVAVDSSKDFITFNFNRASDPEKQRLFRSEEFRRAVSQALDRQAIAELIYGGLAQPSYNSLSGAYRDWVNADAPRYEYDPEAAAGRFGRLGYLEKNTDGHLTNADGRVLEFDLLVDAADIQGVQTAQLIADGAKDAGLKINVQPLDVNTLYAYVGETGDDRQWDAYLGGFSGGGSLLFPVGGGNLTPCAAPLHDFNLSGQCLFPWEETLEALFFQGQSEFDRDKAKAIAYEFQTLENEYLPFIYTVTPNLHFSWNARLRGELPQESVGSFTGDRYLELTWLHP
jgi:peptide/nickel transport system substrate-binding protein